MNEALPSLIQEAIENETIRHMYSKKRCKYCRGRGVKILSCPNEDFVTGEKSFEVQKHLCHCVVQNIKKELDRG